MIRLRNDEFRNKIVKLEKDNKELHSLRKTQSFTFNTVLQELFSINETLKLYDKRHMKEKLPTRKSGYDVKPFKNVVLTDLKRAVATEEACKTTLRDQIN
jgi:DNA-binding ferritin-like protein (Dps family)